MRSESHPDLMGRRLRLFGTDAISANRPVIPIASAQGRFATQDDE